MKRLILGCLSVLLVSATTAPALGAETTEFTSKTFSTATKAFNPKTLRVTQPDSNIATSAKTTESQNLIAQASQRQPLNLSKRFLRDMMVMRMNMVMMAEDALKSDDPEIRSMAQETIKSSNAEIGKMMEMWRKIYEDG